MTTALATQQFDYNPAARHVADAPTERVRYRKPFIDYRRLHEADADEIGDLLREAQDRAWKMPPVWHGSNPHPIDVWAFCALDAIDTWVVREEANHKGSLHALDAAVIAKDCLRRHELMIVVRRVGRLRAPWILRPSCAGYLLELVTTDDPDPRLEGLVIDAALPREQIRALVRAYEAGIKRGQTIARDEINLAFNRAKGRRS